MSYEDKAEATEIAEVESLIHALLVHLGEDPEREGLLKTPHRVAKMYDELFEGYKLNLIQIVNGAIFEDDSDEDNMVIASNIDYKSMCEHHMLPFVGEAHVGYISSGKVIGLSKIPRIVNLFARRLQIQERLTNEIADALESILQPKGVIVVITGSHSCASIRGVKQHDMNMKTMATRGVFKTDSQLRNEFIQLITK